MEPIPSTVQAQSLNHWTSREVPSMVFSKSIHAAVCQNVTLFLANTLMYKWMFQVTQFGGDALPSNS